MVVLMGVAQVPDDPITGPFFLLPYLRQIGGGFPASSLHRVAIPANLGVEDLFSARHALLGGQAVRWPGEEEAEGGSQEDEEHSAQARVSVDPYRNHLISSVSVGSTFSMRAKI
jgi:hypothetical protein